MALYQVGTGYYIDFNSNPNHNLFVGGHVAYYTNNSFEINYPSGIVEDFFGSFHYQSSGMTGTITTINIYDPNGNLNASYSNGNIDVATFLTLPTIPGADTPVRSYMFRGNDILIGGNLNDLAIKGYAGNDVLIGKGGGDHLYGMSGNDRLIGGPGNDVLNGGPGNDTFVFGAGFNRDVIADFSVGTLANHDSIELHSIPGLHNFAQVKSHSAVVDGHVVISDNIGDSITLDSVHRVSQLHNYDFHFMA